MIDKEKDIAFVAMEKLTEATNDYASRIWSVIAADVIEDINECADEEFSDGDVSLAIGRALIKRVCEED